MDTYKYQALRDNPGDCWSVEDRTDARHWSVTFSMFGEPHIVNQRTSRSVNPYGPTGRPIINAVRRALEAEAEAEAEAKK